MKLNCIWCGRSFKANADEVALVGQVCSERCRAAWTRAADAPAEREETQP